MGDCHFDDFLSGRFFVVFRRANWRTGPSCIAVLCIRGTNQQLEYLEVQTRRMNGVEGWAWEWERVGRWGTVESNLYNEDVLKAYRVCCVLDGLPWWMLRDCSWALW